MFAEFKKFIMRGNVLDLAVAVIVGAAFGKITTSLTEDIIMPVIGAIFGGLDFSTGAAHLARAALESMAHQAYDLQTAFAADGAAWTSLSIDGGMAANDWMAQDLADILDLPVERPDFIETTALGAAMLAACGVRVCEDVAEAAEMMRGEIRLFEPKMSESTRSLRIEQWHETLARAIS